MRLEPFKFCGVETDADGVPADRGAACSAPRLRLVGEPGEGAESRSAERLQVFSSPGGARKLEAGADRGLWNPSVRQHPRQAPQNPRAALLRLVNGSAGTEGTPAVPVGSPESVCRLSAGQRRVVAPAAATGMGLIEVVRAAQGEVVDVSPNGEFGRHLDQWIRRMERVAVFLDCTVLAERARAVRPLCAVCRCNADELERVLTAVLEAAGETVPGAVEVASDPCEAVIGRIGTA